MNKTMLIILMSIFSLNILLSGCMDVDSALSLDKMPPIIGWLPETDRVLVTYAPSGLDWSDVNIESGQCTLPSGSITAGDRIFNCTGTVTLMWVPTNTLLGTWEFE